MKISLRQLRAFVETYRAGNLARAAEMLCVTPSAASMSLAQLEEAAGVKLFERTSRGLQPTLEAELAVEHAVRAVDALRALEAHFETRSGIKSAVVTVAATQALAVYLMPGVLNAFSKIAPHVRVDLYDCSSAQLVEMIVHDKVALGIGTFSGTDDALAAEPIMTDTLHAIFMDSSPLAQASQVQWSELAKYPLIIPRYSGDGGIRLLLERSLGKLEKRFPHLQEVASMSTALGMASHGLGVAIYPPFVLRYLDTPGMTSRQIVNPSVTRDLAIASRRGRPRSSEVSLLIDVLREELAA